MELRQIRSFRSIAETLHFGRTAEMMNLLSQLLPDFLEKAEDAVNKRVYIATRP